MLVVQGCVKNYPWGKTGNDSYVAKFKSSAILKKHHKSSCNEEEKSIDDGKQFMAELWFGLHPSGPCNVVLDGNLIRLDSFIQKNPEMVGSIDVYHNCSKTLPYLFKILSIAQPASLQAHPDKKLAQVLHQRDPKNYPDANHKPEMVIAITDLEVVCDFRPVAELVAFFKNVKPLRKVIGEENCDLYIKASKESDSTAIKTRLASCFKALMTSDKEMVRRETRSLIETEVYHEHTGSRLMNLIGRLDKLYPGDPGVMAPFFLNYLVLEPGQAVYLEPNKLHTYVSGECIECMACSDNVVRAALTPKFRDVDTLVKMLNYEQVKESKDILLRGRKHDNDHRVISFAPTSEFIVDKITIDSKIHSDYALSPKSSGSFIVVINGTALAKDFFDVSSSHKLQLGSAGFIPPKTKLELYSIQGTLTIYRAYC